MIPTVTVTTKVHYNNGSPAEGVVVRALLQSSSQNDDGYIVPTEIEAIVDENGDVSLELWPNEQSTLPSFYIIEAHDCVIKELLNVVAVIPESAIPLELEDIALPIATLSLGQASGNVPSIRKIDTLEGIIGGGDFSQNREHKLDLTTITNAELDPTLNHILAIQDPNNPDDVRYASLGTLPGIGYPIEERSFATVGQTEIFVEEVFSPETGQIQLAIAGRDIAGLDFLEESITGVPPYNGKLTLDEPLEGGEEILVRILRTSPFGSGIDASQVTYSGGGTVEDALDTLFTFTGASPWQTITNNYNANSGDRLFANSTGGSFTITLPSTPNPGDAVKIVDVTDNSNISGSLLVNTWEILRNGNTIMDVADDLTIDQPFVSVELVFKDVTRGWRLIE